MIKIIYTKNASAFLERLDLDLEAIIESGLKYVPRADVIGLSHIFVRTLPRRKKSERRRVMASYFRKWQGGSAYIELYVANLLPNVRDAEDAESRLPFLSFGFL